MITYKKAKETALNIDNNINTVFEDSNSYIFSDDKVDTYNPIVINKNTGDIINYLDYIYSNSNDDNIRQIKF